MSTQREKVIEAVRCENGELGRVVGQSLRKLREQSGMTQIQLADKLGIGQASISKMERRGDVQLSTLKKYVNALGASLSIEATFPPSASVHRAFENERYDEHQLVLPLFNDELFQPKRDVVLSIKPQYSTKIMEGEKTVELRRRFPLSAPKGAIAYIYSTTPVMAIVGTAEISEIYKLPINTIWKTYKKSAFIEKSTFQKYFHGLEEGFAIELANVKSLPRQLSLNELRNRFGFIPPQSFLYAKPELRKAVLDEYIKLPD